MNHTNGEGLPSGGEAVLVMAIVVLLVLVVLLLWGFFY